MLCGGFALRQGVWVVWATMPDTWGMQTGRGAESTGVLAEAPMLRCSRGER